MAIIQDLSNIVRPVINDSKTELMLEQFYPLLLTRLMDEQLLLILPKQLAEIDNDDQLLLFINNIWQDVGDRERIINELSTSYHLDHVLVGHSIAKATPFIYKEVIRQAKQSDVSEMFFLKQTFEEIADFLPLWTDTVIPNHVLVNAQSDTHYNYSSTSAHSESEMPIMTPDQNTSSLTNILNNPIHTDTQENQTIGQVDDVSHTDADSQTVLAKPHITDESLMQGTDKVVDTSNNQVIDESIDNFHNNMNQTTSTNFDTPEVFANAMPTYRKIPEKRGGLLKIILPIFALIAFAGAATLYWLAGNDANIEPVQPSNIETEIANNTAVNGNQGLTATQAIENADTIDNSQGNQLNSNQPVLTSNETVKLNTETYIFEPDQPRLENIEDIDASLFEEVMIDDINTNTKPLPTTNSQTTRSQPVQVVSTNKEANVADSSSEMIQLENGLTQPPALEVGEIAIKEENGTTLLDTTSDSDTY